MEKKDNCELCDLVFKRKIKTKKYYEDANFIMVDCATCLVPMLVYKGHTLRIDESDKVATYHLFWKHAQRDSPKDWYVDYEMRKIKDHWHCHLRRMEGGE